MMAESLLYNLHSHNVARDYNGDLVQVNPKLFQEVFKSKYVRLCVRLLLLEGRFLASVHARFCHHQQ